ncbi:hypothetical protein RFI_04735 [Reticulomyxa filosa]|uniref:Uncharacterized protein n=1 Tax=Reticulomyxa filosa TaxID=46433 RepID=X6P2G4_RETFI|nr:hypothetical protein RFI_04735 [Reticulomyxa filosa]|eukprot:ETO32381.1 hypothetical protein RFI_04735 [Reticulomyxa filosa]
MSESDQYSKDAEQMRKELEIQRTKIRTLIREKSVLEDKLRAECQEQEKVKVELATASKEGSKWKDGNKELLEKYERVCQQNQQLMFDLHITTCMQTTSHFFVTIKKNKCPKDKLETQNLFLEKDLQTQIKQIEDVKNEYIKMFQAAQARHETQLNTIKAENETLAQTIQQMEKADHETLKKLTKVNALTKALYLIY